jgi:hypothetical protein
MKTNILFEISNDKTPQLIVVFPVGSSWEKEQYWGISHMLEHCMYYLLSYIVNDQIDIQAYTTPYITTYSISFSILKKDEDLINFMDVLINSFDKKILQPKHKDFFKNEQKIIFQEFALNLSEVINLVTCSNIIKSEYCAPITGDRTSIHNLTLEACINWWKTFYGINNVGLKIIHSSRKECEKYAKIINKKIYREVDIIHINKLLINRYIDEKIITVHTHDCIYKFSFLLIPLNLEDIVCMVIISQTLNVHITFYYDRIELYLKQIFFDQTSLISAINNIKSKILSITKIKITDKIIDIILKYQSISIDYSNIILFRKCLTKEDILKTEKKVNIKTCIMNMKLQIYSISEELAGIIKWRILSKK